MAAICLPADLIVDDDSCEKLGNLISKNCTALDEILAAYAAELGGIGEDAIKSGDASEALKAYIECVDALKGELKTIGETAKTRASQFVQSVDDADEDLY